MGIRAVLDADGYGELDEGLQGLYTEASDGRYVLDAEGVDDLPSVQGLKSTLEKYKKVDRDAGRLQRRLENLAKWEDFEGDPDEVRAALERLQELETGGGDDPPKGEDGDKLKTVYENRMKAQEEKHAKEVAKVRAELEDAESYIERLLIDNRMDAELSAGGVVDEKGVIPQLKKAAKAQLREEYKFRVIKEDGERRAIVETDMGEQDIDTFLESWGRSEDAKAFLHASGNKGSGAGSGSGAGGGRENPWATGNLTEQGRIVQENPALAKSLALQAGKKPPRLAA